MSKLFVINNTKNTRIPFLRGILTKSLQLAGMEFDDAYNIATEVRESFDHQTEVTTEELRAKIEEILKTKHPKVVLTYYKKEIINRENIQIIHANGSREPFSRATHAKRLEYCTIATAKCNAITRKVHSYLIKNKIKEITTKKLSTLTYQYIYDMKQPVFADYYLIWLDFLKKNYPLLLLIGGVPGCGKSTVSNEVANQLEIARVQSTDMLREVMRIMIPSTISPHLHSSSFNAGNLIKAPQDKSTEDHLYYGFQMQSDIVEVGCEAVIQRAINENISVIIEGVHVRPSLLEKIRSDEIITIPIFLSVFKKEQLVRYIKGRSTENNQRRSQRYLQSLDNIWQLQSVLLSEADNANIEIVNNQDLTTTKNDIIKIITQSIAVRYEQKLPDLRKKYLHE